MFSNPLTLRFIDILKLQWKNNNKQLFYSVNSAKQLFVFVFPWWLQAVKNHSGNLSAICHQSNFFKLNTVLGDFSTLILKRFWDRLWPKYSKPPARLQQLQQLPAPSMLTIQPCRPRQPPHHPQWPLPWAWTRTHFLVIYR